MNIVIIGIGSVAMGISSIVNSESNYKITGYIGTPEEDKKFRGKKIFKDYTFLGTREILRNLKKQKVEGFIVAIGDAYIREEAFHQCINDGLSPVNAISKNAFIDESADIGSGVVIMNGSIIQHGVSIGNNCYLGSGSIFEFKSKVNDNCNIGSGCIISSNVEIQKNVFMGAGTVINKKIKIGKNQKIDSNQVVKKNLRGLTRK